MTISRKDLLAITGSAAAAASITPAQAQPAGPKLPLPETGARYASFFRDLDARTEYFDVYGLPDSEDLTASYAPWFGSQSLWRKYALVPAQDVAQKQAAKNALITSISSPTVSAGLLRVDDAIAGLIRTRFPASSGFNLTEYLEAVSLFGSDRLPEDQDR